MAVAMVRQPSGTQVIHASDIDGYNQRGGPISRFLVDACIGYQLWW